MSTSQPDLMVELEKEATARKAYFADAPIARTRQAAVDGTLAIMVGSEKNSFSKNFTSPRIYGSGYYVLR
jgi:3-hydroxyisobutyrate dehydrogenase-like beta-hydroxyacid dehydrogenase